MKNYKNYVIATVLALAFCFIASPTAFASQPPVADAGTDLYLISGQSKTLQGTGTDADGGTLSYLWSCDGGTLNNYGIAQPTYTAPTIIAFNNYDDFTCTLTVTDQGGLTNTDSVKIYVNYNGVLNIVNINPKTESATNIQSNQATLNGSFTSNNNSAAYVWFQYGFSSNYGEETTHQTMTGSSGSFTQNLSSLFLNATYHYRAVVQDSSNQKFYGQDMIFVTGPNFYSSTSLTISKKVINLTTGNLNWTESVNANPSDILSFSITVQANKDLHNVIVKDILPANLIYNDNLLVNAVRNYSDNPTAGINLGTISSGNIAIISYQVKVSPSTSFTFGTTNLNSETTVSSNEISAVTDSVAITVNNSQVSGASTTSPTDLSTGLTNKFLTESFFLPMLLIIAGSWFYFSGKVYTFADWLGEKIS